MGGSVDIHVPNVHPIVDDAFARSQVEKHFGRWLRTGHEIQAYAADLLLRAFATSDRTVPDMIVLGAVFRQALASFDASMLCISGGAIYGALMPNRALLEASLGLQWMLQEGKERWARQYYVSSLRENLLWLRRTIPGRPEHARFTAVWNQFPREERISDPDAIAEREAQESETEALLASEHYRGINQMFEAWRNPPLPKRRRTEPAWYMPGPGGVASLAAMARQLGREAEYITFYRHASHAVHGSSAQSHTYVQDNSVHVFPIRDVRDFPSVFSNIAGLMLDATMRIIDHYRPDERSSLRRTYIDKWRRDVLDITSVRVTVNPDPVTL